HWALGEGLEVLLGVADAARLARPVPSPRVLHEPPAPQRDPLVPLQRPAVEAVGLEPVRGPYHAIRLDAQQLRYPASRVRGEHQQALATAGPFAHALGPGLGVAPSLGRSLLDRAEH